MRAGIATESALGATFGIALLPVFLVAGDPILASWRNAGAAASRTACA